MNSVDNLLSAPFSSRTLEEKIQIKELGRPTPNLNLSQKAKGGKNSEYTRQFNRKIYGLYSWLCGCEVRNAFFCFPCLLLGNSDSFSKSGVRDLGHINAIAKKHNDNKKHINNMLDLSTLGTVNIATQLSRAYHDAIVKHNQQVERNRYILSRIIDCIKFCGAFELALRGHDESDSSENRGIFLGLVDFVSSLDSAVKEHIESNNVFKGTSKTIQNELLDCMLEVCRDKISHEMKDAEFAAVMADETTDISEQTQLAIVFRYIHNGMTYERFWGFFNLDGQNAESISLCILNVLGKNFLNQPNKIIAQTYDGASVMSGRSGGVQAKIKAVYPNAHYIHCYAHQLNLIMEKAASQNHGARVFFCSLSAFPTFFSRSAQRLSALDAAVARRIPSASATRWNFKSRTVNTVYEYRDSLIDCFAELENSPSSKTVQGARGLRHNLEDKDFLFWLKYLKKIMPHVDILYSQLQARSCDAIKTKTAVSHFISVISEVRNSVDGLESDTETTYDVHESKRRKYTHRNSDAKEVCDRIIEEARHRFETTDHLDAAKLLHSAKFKDFTTHFPENEFQIAVRSYSLEKNRLRTELNVLYERTDFREIDGAVPLLQLILTNSLQDTFKEITKLLKIIITTPMTTAEPERCFSSLKRIKSFLRNTMSQDRLNALAMLSIEKSLVSNISDFNTRVIEKFGSKKDRRMDFVYRK